MTPTAQKSSLLSSPVCPLGSPNSGYESGDANERGQLVPIDNNVSDSDSDKTSSVDGDYDSLDHELRGTHTPSNSHRRDPHMNSHESDKTSSNTADNQGLWNKIRQRGFGNRGTNLGSGNEIDQDTGIMFMVVAGIAIFLAVVVSGWFNPFK
ncbi:hypothetical protein GGR53DRAFT_529643 [Hypoxylon sp. FL1150]|nr:hypothetical protein GGR53DRAFT_529643 [Hypoxylon sp. FL1150]